MAKRLWVLGIAVLGWTGCSASTGDESADQTTDGQGSSPKEAIPTDPRSRAGGEAGNVSCRGSGEGGCCNDADCSNHIYCDGIEVCVDGVCQPGARPVCDDGITCTVDSCHETAKGCFFEMRHSLCDDHEACNGEERCVPASSRADDRGCVPGRSMVCDDGDDCTADSCTDGACVFWIRDEDHDGHGDWRCLLETEAGQERGDDCDDSDPLVFPGAEEQCDDGFDNNCDRLRDYEDPTCVVPNDTCSTALWLRPGEPVRSSTRSTAADVAENCGPRNAPDVVFTFEVTETSDAVVRSETRSTGGLFLALTPLCGSPEATLACAEGSAEVQARALEPGQYYVSVASRAPMDFSLVLNLTPARSAPEGDLCRNAQPLAGDGAPQLLDLTGMEDDYAFACSVDGETFVDAVYRLQVDEILNLRWAVRVPDGRGRLALAVQRRCGSTESNLGCWVGDDNLSGVLEKLEPGTYFVLVGQQGETALEVSVTLSKSGFFDTVADWVRDLFGGS